MDPKKLNDFLERKAKELIKDVDVLKLKDWLYRFLLEFLSERRAQAQKVLEIIPDFTDEEFKQMLDGDLQVGDKISIQSPEYLVEAIIEEVRILSNINLKYKH